MNAEERWLQHVDARTADSKRRDCPTAEQLEELAALATSPAERRRVLVHVSSCAACRHDVAMLRAVASTEPARRPFARFPLLGWAAGVAAIAGVAFLIIPRAPADVPIMRSEPTAAALRGSTLLKEGRLQLSWQAIPEAVVYRYELLDDAGGVLAQAATADTFASLPLSAEQLSRAARWTVSAQLLDGRDVASEPMRLLLQR